MRTTDTDPAQGKATITSGGWIAILLIIFAAAFPSCKKEYTDWPYNNIEKFAVMDQTGQELKALIQDGIILIQWPPFQTIPDSVAPEIVISERATVSPASGVRILFEDGQLYEVTAQDGSKKTYTLKISSNQPEPTYIVSETQVPLGGTFGLIGEYFIADTNQTTLHLVDKNQYEIKLSSFTLFNTVSIIPTIPLDIDTGRYAIKFKTGIYTFTKDTISVVRPPFKATVNAASAVSVKRGGELILDIPELTEKWYTNEVDYGLIASGIESVRVEVASNLGKNAGILKFSIPSDLAFTQIDYIEIYDKHGKTIGALNLRPVIAVTD